MTNKEEFIGKISRASAVSAFCIFSIFLFTPMHIYFANINGGDFFFFNTSFREILTNSIILSSLLLIMLFGVLLWTPAKFFKKAVVFIFTLTFAFWFFNNILIWDYGIFDGRTIKWGQFNYRGFVDLFIYSLFLFLLARKASFVYQYSKNTSLILIGIQLFSLLTLDSQPQFKNTMFSKSFLNNHYKYQQVSINKFSFSNKKNVIIIVLDSFQSDLFSEIVNKQKKFNKTFDGFSYFRNAVSGYSLSSFATPFILTGKYFDNSALMEIYLKQAYLSDSSIPKQLKANGFLIDIYPRGHFFIDPSLVSNYIIRRKKLFNYFVAHDLAQLYDIALFRACPHFLKKYIHNNNKLFLTTLAYNFNKTFKWPGDAETSYPQSERSFPKESTISETVEFIHDFKTEISVNSDQPAFKYYHLSGLHPPLILDENLNLLNTPLSESRPSFLRSAEAMLKLMSELLNDLKKHGIYDNSLIFIIGDHGTRYIPTYTKTDGLKASSQISVYSAISSGVPLILVKPFNTRGKLKTNDAPVTLGDIGPTIFDALDMKNEGVSMFKINPNNPLKRKFFLIMPERPGYDLEFEEYEVSGFSWLKSAWNLKEKK